MPNLRRTNPFVKDVNNSFEPSSDSKNKWLLTRKKRYGKGSITLPGLFVTDKFSSDRNFFFIAIVAELVGLYFIWQASGYSNTFIYLVVGAFVVDLFAAIGLHWYQGEKSLYENLLYRFENFEKVEKSTKTDNSIWVEPKTYEGPRKRTIWIVTSFIFMVLIVGLALGKIVLYYFLPPMSIDGITVGIFLSYLFVAYVHIFHTGYYLAEIWVDHFTFSPDWRSYNRLKNEKDNKYLTKDYRKHPFKCAIELVNVAPNGRHFLEAIDPIANQGLNYQFRTWGILTDEDLQKMIDDQLTTEAQSIVAKFGHDLQMEILNREGAVLATAAQKAIASAPNQAMPNNMHTDRLLRESDVNQNRN